MRRSDGRVQGRVLVTREVPASAGWTAIAAQVLLAGVGRPTDQGADGFVGFLAVWVAGLGLAAPLNIDRGPMGRMGPIGMGLGFHGVRIRVSRAVGSVKDGQNSGFRRASRGLWRVRACDPLYRGDPAPIRPTSAKLGFLVSLAGDNQFGIFCRWPALVGNEPLAGDAPDPAEGEERAVGRGVIDGE